MALIDMIKNYQALLDRKDELSEQTKANNAAIEAAKAVNAGSVTIHSNALGEGGVVVNAYNELSDTVKLCSMYDTLLACARLAEQEGINLNLEALNVTTDHVGNFLKYTQTGTYRE